MKTIRLMSRTHGEYNIYIADNHTATTDITGAERYDMGNVITNNAAVDTAHHWMPPAIRKMLQRDGVDADTSIILVGRPKLAINGADNVAAILPHVNAALRARRAREAAESERSKYQRKIYLSSRGWGDYSPVTWIGDIRRPVAEIVLECVEALARANDVDTPLTDDEIVAKVVAAKEAEVAAADKARVDEAKVAAAIAEAKATGKPIVLSSWITNTCHEHLNECSFDRAEHCAMPDGTIAVRYTHCW